MSSLPFFAATGLPAPGAATAEPSLPVSLPGSDATLATYDATSMASLPSTSLAGMKTGLSFDSRAGWLICS